MDGLRAEFSGSEITLFWSRSLPGYQLEARNALATIPGWSPVTNAPVIVGPENAVTVPATRTQQYFRLRR